MTPDPKNNHFVKFISHDMANGKTFYMTCINIALGRGIRRENTEDVYQIFSSKIIESQPKYNPAKGSTEAYLYRTFKNTCNDYARKKVRNIIQNNLISIIKEDGEFITILDPNQTTPLEILIEQENITKIKKTLQKLPPIKRDILYLRILEMSYKQMGNIINIPIGTVKSRLHTSKKALTKLLSEHIQ